MNNDILINKIISTEAIADSVFEKYGRIYTFINPVSYLDAVKHQELYAQMDGIFADGTMVVKAIRLFYHKKVEKREFDMSSMARKLFEFASEKSKSVYIIASKQEEIENATEKLNSKFPDLRILGFRSGYFKDSQEIDVTIKKVISLSPDYLIVGMGAVKQEEFLLMAKEAGYQGIGFTCGAFITQTANYAAEIDFFPDWAVRFNLRFIYRLYKEPHTRKRYLKAGFLFPYRFLCNKYGVRCI
jgi:N-acetylglucosaminyldiphosphoundecaprenol N-acetyl-beta-D-mannosaminyltransferase